MIMMMVWPLLEGTRRASGAEYAKGVPGKPSTEKNWCIAIFSFRVTGSSLEMHLEWLSFKCYVFCVCYALSIELGCSCSHLPYLINFILFCIFEIGGLGISYINIWKILCKLALKAKTYLSTSKQTAIYHWKK